MLDLRAGFEIPQRATPVMAPHWRIGSRLRENAEAKRALRILFLTHGERKSGPSQEFFALFDAFAPTMYSGS